MTDPAALDAAVRCHLPRIRYEVQSGIPSFETLDLVLIAYRRIVSERSWWPSVYTAGIRASLDRHPRKPPDYLTEDQKNVWRAGYDR